jgi:hypothetical protein
MGRNKGGGFLPRKYTPSGTSLRSPQPDALARLHHVRDVLDRENDPGTAEIVAGLDRYLDPRATIRLEEALGLAVIGQAGDAWRAAARRAERDDALRGLAAFYPGLPPSPLADEVGRLIRRYWTRWRRTDRHLAAMPEAYRDTPQQFLFAAFAAGAAVVPTGRTKLSRILATACNEDENSVTRFGISVTPEGCTVQHANQSPPRSARRRQTG